MDTKRNSYAQLQKSHPCFGEHAANTGRIHLPVSPGCNIACRFCNRSINDTENRPGVTSEVLTPEESLDVLARALELCPQIKVAGIAENVGVFRKADALFSEEGASRLLSLGGVNGERCRWQHQG